MTGLHGLGYWLLNHLVVLGFAGFGLAFALLFDSFSPATPVPPPAVPPLVQSPVAPSSRPAVPVAPAEPSLPAPAVPAVEPAAPRAPAAAAPSPVAAAPEPASPQQAAPDMEVDTPPAEAGPGVMPPIPDRTGAAEAPPESSVRTSERPAGRFRDPAFDPDEAAERERARALKPVLLQAARKAFWDDDLEAAESAYLAYVKQFPGDANAFGELGNLYQSMGREAEALDAYVAAGQVFVVAGDSRQLAQIVQLLQDAGDPRAQWLLEGLPADAVGSTGNPEE